MCDVGVWAVGGCDVVCVTTCDACGPLEVHEICDMSREPCDDLSGWEEVSEV